MSDPFSLAIITALVAQSAPSWLEALYGTLLDVGKGFAADKGKELLKTGGANLRGVLHLDEKEQERHLQSALERAVNGGLVRLTSQDERDLYRDILTILFEPGSHSDALRRETMRLFTLSSTPDVATLNEVYNRSLHFRHLTQPSPPQEVNAAPYLGNFFDALIDELYIDPYFKEQLKDALQTRAALHTATNISDVAFFTQITAASVTNIDSTLQQMLALLQQAAPGSHQLDKTKARQAQLSEMSIAEQPPSSSSDNGDEQELLAPLEQSVGTATVPAQKDQIPGGRSDIQRDLQQYALSLERRFHSLSMAGLVHKEYTGEQCVELQDLLVPQHIVIEDPTSNETTYSSIIDVLRNVDHLVLLGSPGFGKSSLLRYLAWSHAQAYLPGVAGIHATLPLLPDKPLPLYIALSRFSQEKIEHANDTFLTYTVRLLQREGVDISAGLIEELLAQGKMLLLFDGLDEISTLQERRTIVTEIEQLASRYPKNRILVTSRSVGYELATLSKKQFLYASLQEFNEEQIGQLLHRWYAYLLGFPVPLPPDAQQEIVAFEAVLHVNPLLRSLAANPLLLTVLISLHRYERLPSERVAVYDRMVSLLLGTWGKLRGTNTRWKEMRMAEEDLYMCLAYLGFVFHKHSAATLPSASLRHEILTFLQTRVLLSSEVEQYAEAERFLELVKMEAGLLVEQGVNEEGEAFYGFVHRSFQEYLAAVHVYERYQQETDLAILSDFLIMHLHDPDWQEVILLLLGKLKSKTTTRLLRQLFTGQIVSVRSTYTHLLQQDLLFVSACLAEEIAVESQLAEEVISTLCQVVKSSPLPSQRSDALEELHRLIHTRRYAVLVPGALIETATQVVGDIATSIRILEILEEQGPKDLNRTHIDQVILALIKNLDLPLKQLLQLVWSWYEKRPQTEQGQRLLIQRLQHLYQEHNGTEKHRQCAQAILLVLPFSNYADKASAIQAIAALLPQDEAKCCIAAYWRSAQGSLEEGEIPFIVELVQQELLPTEIRDELYQLLFSLVPRFRQGFPPRGLRF